MNPPLCRRSRCPTQPCKALLLEISSANAFYSHKTSPSYSTHGAPVCALMSKQ